jgi:hypothetical protein
VTRIEVDADLAARAGGNLSSFTNARCHRNGATVPFDAADVIYVNADVPDLPIRGSID